MAALANEFALFLSAQIALSVPSKQVKADQEVIDSPDRTTRIEEIRILWDNGEYFRPRPSFLCQMHRHLHYRFTDEEPHRD